MLPYYSFLKVLTVLADLREYVLPNQPCTHIQNKEVCLQTKKKKKKVSECFNNQNKPLFKEQPFRTHQKIASYPPKKTENNEKKPS